MTKMVVYEIVITSQALFDNALDEANRLLEQSLHKMSESGHAIKAIRIGWDNSVGMDFFKIQIGVVPAPGGGSAPDEPKQPRRRFDF